MGVEPTRDDAGRPATVLKTAETTGPPPLPQEPLDPSTGRPYGQFCSPCAGLHTPAWERGRLARPGSNRERGAGETPALSGTRPRTQSAAAISGCGIRSGKASLR